MQNPSGIDNLVRRMDALERANRRLGICIALLLAIVSAVLVMGAGSGRDTVVEGRQLMLYDSAGNVRVSIGTGPDGAQIALSDSVGRQRILLASEHDLLRGKAKPRQTAPTIILTDPTMSPEINEVALQAHFLMGSGLWVWSGRGDPVVELGIWNSADWDRAPQLLLHDVRGSTGSLIASVYSEAAALRAPGPSICFRNMRGDCTFQAP